MFKKYVYLFFAAAVVFSSCKKDENTVDGSRPEIIAPSSNFKITNDAFDVYRSEAKFANVSVTPYTKDVVPFGAEFNERVTWYITITGLSSGAKKVLTGTSFKIDQTKPEAQWDGASDNLYFFRKGERAAIELSFYGSNIVKRDTINVTEKKVFDVNCLLVGEFEGDINFNKPQGGVGPADAFYSPNCLVQEWNPFFDLENVNEEICGGQYNENPDFEPKNTCSGAFDVVPKPVQGYGLFYLWGKDRKEQPSNFFIGGFNHDPIAYGLTGDIENYFVNFYANAYKANSSTKLKLEVYGAGDDIFILEIPVDWQGWKLVSIRLSDLSLGEAGAAGPGYLAPEFIKKMGFAILSGGGNAPGTEAYIAIDFVTVTTGTPFDQNQN